LTQIARSSGRDEVWGTDRPKRFYRDELRSLASRNPMMSSASRLLCGCAGAVVLGACNPLSLPVDCTADLRFGLIVTVVDSLTNAPPASATLIARTAAAVDSVGPHSPLPTGQGAVLVLSAAPERPGTYDLTVRAAGYRDWTRTGVRVTADECHVRRVELTARLQK
jgi:hypothetical protein